MINKHSLQNYSTYADLLLKYLKEEVTSTINEHQEIVVKIVNEYDVSLLLVFKSDGMVEFVLNDDGFIIGGSIDTKDNLTYSYKFNRLLAIFDVHEPKE